MQSSNNLTKQVSSVLNPPVTMTSWSKYNNVFFSFIKLNDRILLSQNVHVLPPTHKHTDKHTDKHYHPPKHTNTRTDSWVQPCTIHIHIQCSDRLWTVKHRIPYLMYVHCTKMALIVCTFRVIQRHCCWYFALNFNSIDLSCQTV